MTRYLGPKTDPANVATQSDVGGTLSDATPDALTPDQAGAAGTATTTSRADHSHEIICAAAGTILPDAASAEGSSSSFARADHTHAIDAAAPSANLTATTTNTEGAATSFARSDHSHAITTASAGTITGTIATGTSASLARADHDHALGAGVVGSTQIADGAVTAAKLASGVGGNVLRSGSGAPSSGLGSDGDFYIDTSANTIYGPKTAGSWGSPTSLVGPQGATGATGATGSFANSQTVDAKTANYTLVTADAGKVITMNSSSALTLTVNGSLDLSVGQRIDILQLGTGQVTVSASSATVNATPGLKLRAQYSGASLLCTASDVYVLAGDLTN